MRKWQRSTAKTAFRGKPPALPSNYQLTGEDFLPWKVLASCCCSTKKSPFLFVETWWDQNDFQSQDSGETKASCKPWMINVGLLIFGVSSSGSKTQRPREKDFRHLLSLGDDTYNIYICIYINNYLKCVTGRSRYSYFNGYAVKPWETIIEYETNKNI